MALPGAQDFAVKRQVGAKSDIAWQFSLRFADQQGYDGYNQHPDHLGFATR